MTLSSVCSLPVTVAACLLFELEEENMQKAKDAGYFLEEEPVFKPQNVEAVADETSGCR